MTMSSRAVERAGDDQTPQVILEWLLWPYQYFGRLLKPNANAILDAGCGNNEQEIVLRQFYETVYALDIQRPPRGQNPICGDLLAIPLAAAAVDVTFCFETIEHVYDQEQLFSELLRVTKPGGVVVVGSVSADGADTIAGIEIYKGRLNPYHVKELTNRSFFDFFVRYNATFMATTYNNNYVQWFRFCHFPNKMTLSNYAIVRKQ